ncbi:MAG: hypothetical protein ACKVU1_08180 [bacterium]
MNADFIRRSLTIGLAVVAAFGVSAAPSANAATVRYALGDTLLTNIQSALSAGDTLLVPTGRYLLTETLPAGITVRGEGPRDSVLLVPYIPSSPIFYFPDAGDTTRVENITFDCEENQEASALYFKHGTIAVTGNRFFRGVAILADSCDGTISDNYFENVGSAIRCADSRLWIDRNEIVGAKNGSISMRGSPLRITRNRIVKTVNTGIVIVGKRYVPVIGGEPGMGNEIYGAFNSDVINNSGKDVNAQYNYWGIKSTEEMTRFGFPSNIDAITDRWDLAKDAGEVDFRNFLDAPPPEGKPVKVGPKGEVGAEGAGGADRRLLAIGGGVIVIALLVATRARRARRTS